MLKYFNQQWDTVPLVVVDVETTGTQPGRDRVVQVGLARFENGIMVGARASLIDPGMPIPEASTVIHGITDMAVQGMPTLEAFFEGAEVKALIADCQPCAYNASFDRRFVPSFTEDHSWPWCDPLVLIRKVDRWERGAGRHKLEAACARHGIELTNAHSADGDAKAAGELFYKLGRQEFPAEYTMGRLLIWQQREDAEEWARHMKWRANAPPREQVNG